MKAFSLGFLFTCFLLISLSLVSAADCIPGPYNTTYFCNSGSMFEILKNANTDCLNDYECKVGACTFNSTVGKTVCQSTYKEIKEHTNFLKAFFDRLVGFLNSAEGRQNLTQYNLKFIDNTTLESDGNLQNFIEVNVSYLGLNLQEKNWNITISLYNASSENADNLVRSFNKKLSIEEIDKTFYRKFENLPIDKTYLLVAKLKNPTETLTSIRREIGLVSIDTTLPEITILHPTASQEYRPLRQSLNYVVSDPNLDSCWHSLNGGTTNSTPDSSCSNFTRLLATEGTNTWTVYAKDSSGNEASRSVTFTAFPPDPEAPQVISINASAGAEYYPDSIISLNATVKDNTNGILEWILISNVSGILQTGTVTAIANTPINVSTSFSLPKSLLGAEQQHNISFIVNDSSENSNKSQFFIVNLKNENCTDLRDNDADGILDTLDADCNGTGISLISLSTNSREFSTFGYLNADCEYSSTFEDSNSLRSCIKLNVSNNICTSQTIDLETNKLKFRNCPVGDTERFNYNLTCYVVPDCMFTVGKAERIINITEFDICNNGEVGENNLTLELNNPSDSEHFYSGDSMEIDLDVYNEYDSDLDLILETQLYDVNQSRFLLNKTSNISRINSLDENNFFLEMILPDNLTNRDNIRLYYKVYKSNDEDLICRSESIRIYIGPKGCVDSDNDGYCAANDCNDTNLNINPRKIEICTDNIDNDCNLLIDEDDLKCNLNPDDDSEIGPEESVDIGELSSSGNRKFLSKLSKLDFQVNSEDHSIFVNTITKNSVIFTISSEPFNVSFDSGQTRDIDLNQDGSNEIKISLNGVLNDQADVTIRKISSSNSLYSIDDSDITEDGESNSSAAFNILVWGLLFAFIIGLIIFLVFSFKKRKDNRIKSLSPPPLIRRPLQ